MGRAIEHIAHASDRPGLEAVSYTHLDVYKRQANGRGAGGRGPTSGATFIR